MTNPQGLVISHHLPFEERVEQPEEDEEGGAGFEGEVAAGLFEEGLNPVDLLGIERKEEEPSSSNSHV